MMYALGAFLGILAAALIIIAALAGVVAPFFISLECDLELRTKVWIHVAGLLVTVGAITVGVLAMPPSNNAQHCGTGTTYQESSHYDPATKTSQTDWWCTRG